MFIKDWRHSHRQSRIVVKIRVGIQTGKRCLQRAIPCFEASGEGEGLERYCW